MQIPAIVTTIMHTTNNDISSIFTSIILFVLALKKIYIDEMNTTIYFTIKVKEEFRYTFNVLQRDSTQLSQLPTIGPLWLFETLNVLESRHKQFSKR